MVCLPQADSVLEDHSPGDIKLQLQLQEVSFTAKPKFKLIRLSLMDLSKHIKTKQLPILKLDLKKDGFVGWKLLISVSLNQIYLGF